MAIDPITDYYQGRNRAGWFSTMIEDRVSGWYDDPHFAGILIQPFNVSGDERLPHGIPTFLPRDTGRDVIRLSVARYEGRDDATVTPVFRENDEKRLQEQVRILREALLEIAGTSANENSEPDRMADALGEIQGIVHRALEATKEGV